MADLIVVLDGAHMTQVGTHKALLTKVGPCSELYGIQAAGVSVTEGSFLWTVRSGDLSVETDAPKWRAGSGRSAILRPILASERSRAGF